MKKKQLDLVKRTHNSFLYIVEPLNRNGQLRTDTTGLPWVLMQEWVTNIIKALSAPITTQYEGDTLPLEFVRGFITDDEIAVTALQSTTWSEFWYILLTTLDNTIQTENVASDEIPSLLLHSIQFPKNCKKKKVPRELDKLKASLMKWLCPLLVGIHSELEDSLSSSVLSGLPRQEMYCLVAEYLAGLFKSNEAQSSLRKRKAQEKILSIWNVIILPRSLELLSRYSYDLINQEFTSYTLDKVEEAYLSNIIGDEEDVENEESLIACVADLLPEPKQEKQPTATYIAPSWLLIHNPHAQKIKSTPFDQNTNHTLKSLGRILKKAKVTSTVPLNSIVNAINFYEEATSAGVNLERVKINGEPWSKIKRGDTRILCRRRKGQTEFYVFPRSAYYKGFYDH